MHRKKMALNFIIFFLMPIAALGRSWLAFGIGKTVVELRRNLSKFGCYALPAELVACNTPVCR